MARFQAMNDQRPAADHVGHGNFMDHLKNTLNSGDMDLPGGARAPKARKPYTISKQREKWTEDEHKLFLEALQQHGRAWRRIQEHIGSKTAVQIRSHAQKFFSKVIRESSGDSNSVAAPPQIQIPPPRPKRRPTHPYPRKLGNSVGKDASAIKQLQKPPLQTQSLSEQENCSPKSVLSTAQIDSETLQTEGSGSPASSVYMEDKCLTPSTSVALSKDATTSNDAACEIPEGPILRLFGKRVVVNNLDQQPSSNTGSLQHVADMELDASDETPTSGTGKLSSQVTEEAKTWCPWLTGTQQFMYYLPQGEVFSMHSACQFLNYGNGSISYTVLNAQTVTSNKQQNQPSQAVDCKVTRAEGSWTESNTTSSSVAETTKNSDSIECTKVNNDEGKVIPVPGSRKCASTVPPCLRGFVPYKKCTAQSKMLQSEETGEEADRDMTRLCL
ncbi:protein REVEILLE 2-like [Miscanthus floridulus]|uniref:protein REVEILLE 2-like n=1 Tax=Miscanthus floridulus TaxID=154761 RepID=UPI0034582613